MVEIAAAVIVPQAIPVTVADAVVVAAKHQVPFPFVVSWWDKDANSRVVHIRGNVVAPVPRIECCGIACFSVQIKHHVAFRNTPTAKPVLEVDAVP